METRRAVMAFLLAACVVMTALSLGVHRVDDLAKPKLRVGVYDNRAVAIAYTRSEAGAAAREALKADLEAARKDGDPKRVGALEHAFDRMQWLTHRQGFGRASVDDAMNRVKDKVLDVAKKANVSLIACNPDYLDPLAVERVDLTDEIVALFDPDEKTLQMVKGMKSVKPIEVGFEFQD
jgi:hypothetical protein